MGFLLRPIVRVGPADHRRRRGHPVAAMVLQSWARRPTGESLSRASRIEARLPGSSTMSLASLASYEEARGAPFHVRFSSTPRRFVRCEAGHADPDGAHRHLGPRPTPGSHATPGTGRHDVEVCSETILSSAGPPFAWKTWRCPTLPRLKTQYHRRRGFSRPSSGWDRVFRPRHGHQVVQADDGLSRAALVRQGGHLIQIC